MEAANIFKHVGHLAFVATTGRDFTTPSSRVEGRIDEHGIFQGEINFAQGYHITSPKGEIIETPRAWGEVKNAMERHSMNWNVLRERKRGDYKVHGYTVQV